MYKSKHLKKYNNPSSYIAIRAGIVTVCAILIIVCGYFAALFFWGG